MACSGSCGAASAMCTGTSASRKGRATSSCSRALPATYCWREGTSPGCTALTQLLQCDAIMAIKP